MLFLLICASIAYGAYAWKRPAQALAWFPLLLPSYLLRTTIGPIPTTGLEMAFAALVIGITTVQGPHAWKAGWEQTRPWRLPLTAWTLATAFAVYIAPNHIGAIGLWRAYVLEPLMLFVLAHGVLNTEDRRTLIRAFILGAFSVAIWSTFQFATGLGIPHPWDTVIATRRATGPFPFPNAAALFCGPIAALSIGLLIFRIDLVPRRWIYAGIIAGTVGVLLAKSAGGTIAIVVSTLCALVFNAKTRKIGLAVIICSGIAYASAPMRFTAPLTKLVTFQDWSGYVRLRMWKDTVTMLRDRPFTGAGLGAYPTVFKPYQTTTGIEVFQYPHNILLNLWSETGLLGVLAFASIVIAWFRLGHRHPWTLLPLIAILTHGLVDVPYFKNDLAFAFWGFALIASLSAKQKSLRGEGGKDPATF